MNTQGAPELRTIVLVLLALMVHAGNFYGAKASAQDHGEAAVKEALIRSTTSFEQNNIAAATLVWSNDETLIVFEQGHANYGWKDYRDNHLGPEMSEMKNTKYALSNIRVHLAGKTAWATFNYTIGADLLENGKQRHVDGAGLGTAILEKQLDGWRIVHWHSSAPRRAPASVPPKNP
jgi:ketosteroid isomerase-like protein